MNRSDFKEIAQIRLRDAKALLKSGNYAGAYYLAGYAIECALKACIAKQTRRYEFPPDRKTVEKLYTHDLVGLAKEAGLYAAIEAEGVLNKSFQENWKTVTSWKEGSRYEKHTRAEATDLY